MEGSILIALWSRVDPVLPGAQLTEILGSPDEKCVDKVTDVQLRRDGGARTWGPCR